jgi:hypothetical protein
MELRYLADNQILTPNLAIQEVQVLVGTIAAKINAHPNMLIGDLIF